MMRKERETWIDILKGMAIILVVMGHVVTSYRNSGMLLDAILFNFIYELIYSFHMPLFFIISGYLASKSTRRGSLSSVIVHKCFAYGIPYVLFSIVAFVLNVLAQSVVNTQLELSDLLLIVFYPITSLWYIYALLIISIISEILNHFLKGKYSLQIICISWICMVIVQMILKIDGIAYSRLSECIVFDVCKYYFWFSSGEYFGKILTEEVKDRILKIKWQRIIIWWGIFIGFVYIYKVCEIRSNIVNIFCGFFGTGLCWSCAMKISNSKIMEYLGKQTLPIYLLHGYVISFVRIILNRLDIPLLNGFIPLMLGTVLGVGLPVIVYIISTKIRGMDIIFYPNKYIFTIKKKMY